MGLASSSVSRLSDNENLNHLSGKTTISENDPFWNQMLSFTLHAPKTRAEQVQLEEITDAHCKALVENNQHTGNFTALLKVFLSRSKELKSSADCEDKIFTWQAHNVLFIIRHVCKFLAENMSEENMLEQFEARSLQDRQKDLESGAVLSSASSINYLDEFVAALQEIILEVPVLEFTYPLHLEAVTTYLVLLSTKMFTPSPSRHGVFSKRIMNCTKVERANNFIKALLQHYIEQKPDPNGINGAPSGSLVLGMASAVASGLWSMVSFARGQKGATNGNTPQQIISSTLGHRCTLLFLVLVNYTVDTKRNDASATPKEVNFYHEAMERFRHIQGSATMNPSRSPSFHLNLSRLFQALCDTQHQETSTLLLYFLLHKNPEVRAFVLSKTDIDKLVVPILKILYSAPDQNSHHIYMALIILLILTEDNNFNQSVHELKIKSVEWYSDRMLQDVTLGDLIILVVIRTIQYNMTRMRDRYLHTNCLAALANMSAHFKSLHSYACQRMFSLFALLVKKQRRVAEKLTAQRRGITNSHNAAQHSQNATALDMDGQQDYTSELSVLVEVIRMLLEILNSCLTGNGIRHNVNLVYALLHQKEIFQQFQHHLGFQDILQNIDTIIKFFSGRLDQCTDRDSMTIEEVHEVLKDAMLQLPSHVLKKFPELKFRYVEEDSPEEFFVPYVWSLVFNKSNVFWNPGCVQLFALDS